ncbi:MAG: Crp/Fnr family transcriptional regulator [Hyphomicrobiaceae bacterium]
MESSRSVVDLLRRCELLAGLEEDSLAECQSTVNRRLLSVGDTLIRHDDAGDEVYFVISGSLRVIVYASDGRAILFRDLTCGETIGELAALDRKPRSATVEARSESEVLAMSGAAFRDLVVREPAVALAVLKRTIGLVRELSERIVQLSSLGVANRIHAELLRLVRATGSTENRVVLSPAPRQSDIADRIATNREAVSREVSHLAREGLVARQGRNLIVTDVERLGRLVSAAGCLSSE